MTQSATKPQKDLYNVARTNRHGTGEKAAEGHKRSDAARFTRPIYKDKDRTRPRMPPGDAAELEAIQKHVDRLKAYCQHVHAATRL